VDSDPNDLQLFGINVGGKRIGHGSLPRSPEKTSVFGLRSPLIFIITWMQPKIWPAWLKVTSIEFVMEKLYNMVFVNKA